jgi:DNA-binding GntR family transcriptional regulator
MDERAEYRDRGGLAITIGDAEALRLYDDAVDAFAAGAAAAASGPLIEQCLERVPRFALGRACEALVKGSPPRSGWPPVSAGLTRRERQHLEIVAHTIAGDGERASGLAREHLAEFPTDRLIAAAFSERSDRGTASTRSAPRQRDSSQ